MMTTDVIDKLKLASTGTDPGTLLSAISDFDQVTRDSTTGAGYVAWITDPANLTQIHQNLANNFSIPQKLMAIRRGQYSRTRRAALLLLAMSNAVKRTHNL